MENSNTTTSFEKWKPIEIMLGLLFLVAPFYYNPHIGGAGLRLPNNIIIWMVATVICAYSLYQFANRKTLTVPKCFAYIAAFPILSLISGFVTGVADPMAWLFRVLFIWFGLFFFIALFQYKLKQARVDRLLFIVVISALMQAAVGIWQVNHADLNLLWIPSSNSLLGPNGFFQQINNQATYQVTAVVIAIFLLTRPYVNRSYWKAAVVLLFLAIGTYVVSLSGSRIGALTALICLPLTIIGIKHRIKNNKNIFTLAAVFLIAGTIAGSSGFIKVANKSLAINSGYSASMRLGIYAVSLDLIKQKPLFGHGLGSFESVWQYEKANFYKTHPDDVLIADYVTHPHNEIFLWMIEGGLTATIGIFILLLGIALSLKGKNKHRKAIYLAMILPILLHTQVELPFYLSALHWFLIIIILFVIMRINTQVKSIALSTIATNTTKLTAVLFLIIGIVFFSHTLASNYQLGQIFSAEKGRGDIKMVTRNPYFRKLGINLQMNSAFLKNNELGVIDGTEEYIAWAEDYIKEEPSFLMFTYLAMAYQNIGQEEKMCNVIRQGATIYPNYGDLISGVKFCLK
jgi:O-antigen ligase